MNISVSLEYIGYEVRGFWRAKATSPLHPTDHEEDSTVIEGVGTGRGRFRAVAFALEDLAKKIKHHYGEGYDMKLTETLEKGEGQLTEIVHIYRCMKCSHTREYKDRAHLPDQCPACGFERQALVRNMNDHFKSAWGWEPKVSK